MSSKPEQKRREKRAIIRLFDEESRAWVMDFAPDLNQIKIKAGNGIYTLDLDHLSLAFGHGQFAATVRPVSRTRLLDDEQAARLDQKNRDVIPP